MAKNCSLDILILFIAKLLRMFSFGAISVVFFFVLIQKGLSQKQIGFLQSFVAVGDIIISLILTTQADKIGRKKTLICGAFLKIVAGVTYALSDSYAILMISGALGVLTVSGGQIGPFLPVEQAAIAQIIEQSSQNQGDLKKDVALAYGAYNMVSYLGQASGNLITGIYFIVMFKIYGGQISDYYSHVLYLYAFFGFLKVLLYSCLSEKIQVNKINRTQEKKVMNCAGLTKQNTKVIIMLSMVFFIDAFAAGFVGQSFISYYYQQKYNFSMDAMGGVLFFCNIIGGVSGMLSSKLVGKIGAMATMIFTHLPSNIFLIFISLVTNRKYAILLIMGRFCISQMDVPARQTYVSMVVSSQQRSAANGITNIVRSIAMAISFPIAGIFWQSDPSSFMFSFPFLLAGSLKIIYDLTLGACFLKTRAQMKKQEEGKFYDLKEVEGETQKQQKSEIDPTEGTTSNIENEGKSQIMISKKEEQ